MKRVFVVAVGLFAILAIALTSPVRAEPDLSVGKSVFGANCASCHRGGINVVMADKTLKKAALEKYSMASLEAITNQVRNGKGGMPSFKGRLSEDQIQSVAAYVLAQADADWK
jgi:cytochrome c6